MKKSIFKHFVVLLLMLMTATIASAQEKKAYVWYDDANNSINFYYDTLYDSRGGLNLFIEDGTRSIIRSFYLKAKNAQVDILIEKVVFDVTFAEFRPKLTLLWFADSPVYHSEPALRQIIGPENLNTSEVVDMSSMFEGCKCLTNLDVSSWDTSSVTDLSSMFYDCTGLTTLDLSNWNTNNVKNTSTMFYNCDNLKTIYVGDLWNMENVTHSYYMFTNCISLVGGEGTVYDEAHTNATYAHVDGGTDNPGYFTLKSAVPTAIDDALHLNDNGILTNANVQRFSIDGTRLSSPRCGVNIVRQADGTMRKVMIK